MAASGELSLPEGLRGALNSAALLATSAFPPSEVPDGTSRDIDTSLTDVSMEMGDSSPLPGAPTPPGALPAAQ